jgi:hypothetical protein
MLFFMLEFSSRDTLICMSDSSSAHHLMLMYVRTYLMIEWI